MTSFEFSRRISHIEPYSLASAIEKLLNDETLRHQMGERGHQMFQEKFTEQQFENTMLQCLIRGME